MNLLKWRVWSKDHPLLLVVGDPDGCVTMGATENECLIFGFLSEEEPNKVEEALMDPDWVISKQDGTQSNWKVDNTEADTQDKE